MATRSTKRWKAWLPWILILGAGLAAYANSFAGAFQFDDFSSITGNPGIRSLDPVVLWRAFGLRILGYLTFALNFRLGGLDVAGYHAVNLAIHLGNACLLFALARLLLTRAQAIGLSPLSERATQAAALTAALLFVVHPAGTQAVSYIVQRLASQAAFFYLLALVLYAAGRRRMAGGEGRGWPWIAGALVATTAAMLTKQNAFTLPAALLLVELCFFQRFTEGRLRRLPLFAAACLLLVALPAALLVAGGASLDDLSELTRETTALSRHDYFLTQLAVVREYLRLLVFPVGQRLDYAVPISTSLWQWPTLLSACLHAGMFLVAALCFRRRRAVSFGILFFYLAHAIESGIVPIRDLMVEHRTYLPAAGIFLAAAALVWEAQERWHLSRKAVWIAIAAIVIVLGAATHQRNEIWKTPERLWGEVLRFDPMSWRANYNLGKALEAEGDLGRATERYRASLTIRPTAWAFNNLGNMLLRTGHAEEGIEAYRQALVRDYAFPNAHANLSVALEMKGDLEGAKRENREALRFDDAFAAARYNLGRIAMVEGDLATAEQEFRETLRLDPNHALAHYRLGVVLEKTGRRDDAIGELARALELNPGDERTRRALQEIRK